MLKLRKLNSQFRVTLRKIGSYKNKNFKERGNHYLKSRQIDQKGKLPSSQRVYLKKSKSFRNMTSGGPALSLLKRIPYFILRAGGTSIWRGKRHIYTPFSRKVSERKLGTLFKYSVISKDLSKRSYSRLVRYQRNGFGAILKKSAQSAVLQKGAFFHGSFKGRFNSIVVINSTLVSILSQLRYSSSSGVTSLLSPLTALPSLFKTLYGPVNLSKLLGVGFSIVPDKRFSKRKRPLYKAIIKDKKLPNIDVNLTTMENFLGYYLYKGPLSPIAASIGTEKGPHGSVFSFLKRKVIQKERGGSKLPKVKKLYPFPIIQRLERDFYERGRLNSYWYLEKRGWLPLIQLLDGVGQPLSYWPDPEVKTPPSITPSKITARLLEYKVTLLESLSIPSTSVQHKWETAYTPSYKLIPLEFPDPEEWLMLDDAKDIKRSAYTDYTRYRGTTRRPFVKFYKSLRPGRLLNSLAYPSTLHDVALTSKSRQYHTFKKLFNYIDWKFLYKRTIFGKKTLSKREVLFHSIPTKQLVFYSSLCDPKTSFFTLANRGRQTVKNYLCINNFTLGDGERFLPLAVGEGSWSLNKMFFINDTLGVSPKVSKMAGSAYVRPDLLTDWVGVSKNITTTHFSKIDPVSFEDEVKFSGHPAFSLVSEINHYHNSSSHYMSTYLSTLFKQRVSGILSMRHAQFGKNR